MKPLRSISMTAAVLSMALTIACSNQTPKAPDVSGDIRHALDQAGLNDVRVSQDRTKAVVTLGGSVSSDDDKAKAESVAKSIAGTQVVADEIAVRPQGEESTAKKVDSNLDSAIDKNLEAMLVEHKLNRDIRYDVNKGVVTLKGDVPSQAQRDSVQKMAQGVPNVKQVVNELEVKNQKATSSK